MYEYRSVANFIVANDQKIVAAFKNQEDAVITTIRLNHKSLIEAGKQEPLAEKDQDAKCVETVQNCAAV